MNIETLLPFEHIVLGLEATTKEEVVRQLAKILVMEGIVQSENEYVQSVMEREDHSTTGRRHPFTYLIRNCHEIDG